MDGILAVLDDSDKLQSMGLLLRTFTAASVQQDLDNILCGRYVHMSLLESMPLQLSW